MKRNRRKELIVTVLCLAILVGCFIVRAVDWYSPVISDEQGFKYKVKPGASIRSVSDDLYQQHILKYPSFFVWISRIKNQTHALKAGEYLFAKHASPAKILEQVVTGTGMVNYSFTIVPGTTFSQIRSALNKDVKLEHTTRQMSDATIMKTLGHPEFYPEGQFFPDTYYFVEGTSDLVVLKHAFQAMQDKVTKTWAHRTPNLPFISQYQALIAASIVEKEAYLDSERPIIAGVLINRLRRNILLQFDPTVIYGMGSRYHGIIYKSDLLKHTSYNTYVHKGLPPTPIAMPSLASIEAVMRPDANNYIYFVARGDGSSHQFSRTLAEHNAAVASAKKYHPWFFNMGLVKQYLLKSFTKKIFNTE